MYSFTCLLAKSLPLGKHLPLAAAIFFRVFRALSSLPLSTSNLALSGNHYKFTEFTYRFRIKFSTLVSKLAFSLVIYNGINLNKKCKHCYTHTYTAGGSKNKKRQCRQNKQPRPA